MATTGYMGGGRVLILSLVLAILAGTAQAGDAGTYGFNPAAYKKKAFEVSGYVEGKGEWFDYDRRSVFYRLDQAGSDQPSQDERGTATGEITAKYTRDIATLTGTFHTFGRRDVTTGDQQQAKLYTGTLTLQPNPGLSFDIGKKTLQWGKGLAWNPVGFVQRAKDPLDPDLSREGYWMVTGTYTKSFPGWLQTVGFTPVFIPTSTALNPDFGTSPHHQDVAGKISVLAADTDIDVMALSGGAKSFRYGADFSRNFGPRLEVHGEYAEITKARRVLIGAGNRPYTVTGAAPAWLLGLQYLSADGLTTTVAEFYHNGAGYRPGEQEAFFTLADRAVQSFDTTGSGALLDTARTVSPSYATQNPGRDYLNVKITRSQPFGMVYLTPSVTVMADVADKSALILPELLYTGFTNWEIRLRLQANVGARYTEYGEKAAAMRGELRVRYYF